MLVDYSYGYNINKKIEEQVTFKGTIHKYVVFHGCMPSLETWPPVINASRLLLQTSSREPRKENLEEREREREKGTKKEEQEDR
jgi:hypothetical protein